MKVQCTANFTDGSSNQFEVENPAGAVLNSLATALEAIKVAEEGGKNVKEIAIHNGDLNTRECLMRQARICCPHKVF